MNKVPITFFFTVKNEEINLPYALAAVTDWAQETLVLDSGSNDRTRQITEEYAAKFFYHEWLGYAGQKNWGLDNLPIPTEWVFIIDADEIITPALREELTRIVTENKCPENGFFVNRYFIFLGKRIRHCGYYPSWNIRFFRKGKARYEHREVHEHMIVDGKAGYLAHPMEHYDRRPLEFYISKHNHYSTLEAHEMHRIRLHTSDPVMEPFFSSPQARRRWIKQRVWPHLPARWAFRFFYMYIWRLGILDGWIGFHFCLFLASYEHQVGLKLFEMGLKQPPPPTPSRA